MPMSIARAKARVRRGVEVLDNNDGIRDDWDTVIDLDTIDVDDAYKCPLGQILGEYGHGYDVLDCSYEDMINNGFTTDDHRQSSTINEAWRIVIEERREERKQAAMYDNAYNKAFKGALDFDEVAPTWWEEIDKRRNNHGAGDMPGMLLTFLRILGSEHDLPVYGETDGVYPITHGFKDGEDVEELEDAWLYEIEKRMHNAEQLVESNGFYDANLDTEETTIMYIVLTGEWEVGLITEDESEANAWIKALTSVGQQCALVEKKKGA